MNRIRRELDEAFGPGEKLVYGEPWGAQDSPLEPDTHPALKRCLGLLDPGVGVFCDLTRDAVKGDTFREASPGFVNGGEGFEQGILKAVDGWREGAWEFDPISCSQIVNYVSAHDNFTLWDKMVMCLPGQDGGRDPARFDGIREDLLKQNRLAAFIYFTCLGRLFMQAGEEFGRTKHGEGNSYCSSPEVNMLRWERAWRFGELTDYYRGLIRLRKSLPGLCDKSASAWERVTAKTVHRPRTVSFQVEGGGPRGERLLIVYNAGAEAFSLSLPDGRWTVRADGQWADQRRPAGYGGEPVEVPAYSGMLLLREDG